MTQLGRLYTIDAMRGLAALAVAFYHIHTPAFQQAGGALIDSLKSIMQYGFLGVPIFFAISGFVISATMTRIIGIREYGQFMVKRSVRLDPAYWASIALDIFLTWVAIQLTLPHSSMPSFYQAALHLVYLQDIIGVKSIVAIYWTLALEIQFYLVFGLIMATGGRFRAPLMIAVTAYSMAVAINAAPSLPGLFLSHWCMFVIGAAAHYYSLVNRDRWPVFIGILLCMGAIISVQASTGKTYLNLAAAMATAAFFFIGAMRGRLRTWLNWPALLYLGSRSYSIYLFHAIIGERVAKLLVSILGESVTAQPLAAMMVLVLSLGVSLIVAELAFRLVEKPTLRFSRRLFAPKIIQPEKTATSLLEMPSGTQT